MKEDPLFHEVQAFRQPWVWLPVLGVASLFWYVFVVQILLGHPVGARPMSDPMALAFWVICGLLSPLFLWTLRLETVVRPDSLCFRFFPILRWRKIPWEQLKEYRVLTYRPIAEYLGWGIRLGPHGLAYTVHGNRGVQVVLASGRRILLGSQKPEELVAALDRARATPAHGL